MESDRRSHVVRKSLREPDVERRFERGVGRFVDLGTPVVGSATLEPGWRWSEHIKPNVGTESCRIHHLHLLLAGRFAVRMDSGETHEFNPMDVMDIPPGHDAWVVGEETVKIIDIAGNATDFNVPVAPRQTIGTMLMTDIVGSTVRANAMGDATWKQALTEHNRVVRHQLERFGGREIKTTGDGSLALFGSVAAALGAAIAIRDATAAIGIPIRAGVHTGEVELTDDDVRGIAVHTTARVMSAATDAQVLTTPVTRALIGDAAYRFADAGERVLKGFAEPMRLLSVERS